MNSDHTLRLGHIGLNVTDVERSRQFYEHVLGFQVMRESHEENRRFVFLGDGKQVLLTLWQQSEGAFSARRPGLHHLAFQVEGIEIVEEYQRKLRDLKVPLEYEDIVPHAEGADSGGIFFFDPDGIRLEIYSPTGAGKYAPSQASPS